MTQGVIGYVNIVVEVDRQHASKGTLFLAGWTVAKHVVVEVPEPTKRFSKGQV